MPMFLVASKSTSQGQGAAAGMVDGLERTLARYSWLCNATGTSYLGDALWACRGYRGEMQLPLRSLPARPEDGQSEFSVLKWFPRAISAAGGQEEDSA